MQYRVCPDCRSHLDHGERCTCRDKKEDEATPLARKWPLNNNNCHDDSTQGKKMQDRIVFPVAGDMAEKEGRMP